MGLGIRGKVVSLYYTIIFMYILWVIKIIECFFVVITSSFFSSRAHSSLVAMFDKTVSLFECVRWSLKEKLVLVTKD